MMITNNKENKLADAEKAGYGKVAVLFGGESSERDISLLSGDAIYQALLSKGIDAIKIDAIGQWYKTLIEHDIDRVFIALHGRDGEDGVVQGFLKILNIAYTGSDTASSALAMNKQHSKQIWKQLGFSTAPFEMVTQNQSFDFKSAKQLIARLGKELFVKPVREGSSVGMSKVANVEELIAAIKLAQKYDDVLVEKFIDGKEYTVSILNGMALPSIRMVTPNEFYDYDAKYCSSSTEYFCPSGLSQEEEIFLGQRAVNAFDALGCSGWGRIDFIRDGYSGDFMLLEVNTVPGMTHSSLVPKSAKITGVDFPELVMSILDTSYIAKKVSCFQGDENG